ncbi:hypothetical protein [Kitasatospora sp. NPDC018619]|uniref:hypothetical protein n=1 Tax=unclassified Kitasatospora TaxID=2633591 RepID=UPI00379C9002
MTGGPVAGGSGAGRPGAEDGRPFAVVLLDVNGTLVPSTPGPPPDRRALERLRRLVARLTATGVAVGLCSDSPLEQLWGFGERIGLGTPPGFPVVAENGNVVAVDGTVRTTTPFPALPGLRAEVAAAAAARGLTRVDDVVAPEFGGRPPTGRDWAFGANRQASAGVFGAPDFIHDVRRRLTGWSAANRLGLSVELAPGHAYAVIHPYPRTASGKRVALAALAARAPRRRFLLVGNSPADWVPGVANVGCAFVADPSVPPQARDAAWYVSPRPELAGVVDILEHLLRRQPPTQGSARSRGGPHVPSPGGGGGLRDDRAAGAPPVSDGPARPLRRPGAL